MLRLIKMTRGEEMGTVVWSIEQTLEDAYKKCLTESLCCRRLLFSVESELANKDLVRVTSTSTDTYWIQSISAVNEPLPILDMDACGCVGMKIE